jgi:hypothetical protein
MGMESKTSQPLTRTLLSELCCEEALIVITATKGGNPETFNQVALVFPGTCRIYAYTTKDSQGNTYLVGYKIV